MKFRKLIVNGCVFTVRVNLVLLLTKVTMQVWSCFLW